MIYTTTAPSFCIGVNLITVYMYTGKPTMYTASQQIESYIMVTDKNQHKDNILHNQKLTTMFIINAESKYMHISEKKLKQNTHEPRTRSSAVTDTAKCLLFRNVLRVKSN